MFAAACRRAAAATARRPIHLLTTVEQCQSVTERLLSSGASSVAVDCEGPQLGRFGTISLVQLATETEVFLLDVAVGGSRILEPLASLLQHRELVKVFHDCREDASTLLHRHSTKMVQVFDTQVGHMAWLERRNLEPYQASLGEVLRTFDVDTYRAHRWDELERRPIAAQRWAQRPLEPNIVRYAVEGVAHLLPLQKAICRALGDPGGDLVLRRSARYLEYADMNRAELPSADMAALRPGLPLRAMLATRRPDAAYFKLNRGTLTGAVLDATDLRDFKDLRHGDIVACRVKSVSSCMQFVHLQREGHGSLFFDHRQLEVRSLPSREDVDRLFPQRESSTYGLGAGHGSHPAIEEDPPSYAEKKPEVFHKKGKRGNVKVRKTGYQMPRLQSQQRGPPADHRSWATGDRSGSGW